MGDIKQYYKKTENALPNPILRKFIIMNISPEDAIDLGCGAGRDTICLIKNGWKVLSIDKENTKEIIASKLDKDEIKKFRFQCQNFESIKLEKVKLINANFCLSFCNKKYFNEFWHKIICNIKKDGYFVGNFFGVNDSWARNRENMVFLSKEQVMNLFKDSFDILKFGEVEKDGETALGKEKHWHIFNVIAKKI